MARETTTSTLDWILLRVVDRLINFVEECTKSNTYISTVSDELPANADERMFEVSPSDNWQFDEGHIDGAGRNALHAVGGIEVIINTVAQNDEQGRDTEYLTNRSRGILVLVTKILDALSNHDLLDEFGNEMLSEPLRPTGMSIPPKRHRKKGSITIAFECRFDWHMPTPDPPTPI